VEQEGPGIGGSSVRSAFGGAGNPGGANALGTNDGTIFSSNSGTGGLLIMFVETIAGSGTVVSKGTSGAYESLLTRPGGGASRWAALSISFTSILLEVLPIMRMEVLGGTGGKGGNGSIAILQVD
jgi:hypothetical protein